MRRCLADTQIVLWAGGLTQRLSPPVRKLLEDPAQEILVSSVSIAEMVIKQTLGKLSLPVAPLDLVTALGFETLPLTATHSQRMASLPLRHRDPFDRMLIAQALSDHLVMITSDSDVAGYPELEVVFAG